jgi:pimeloyl-ACP methyl ester carboxylesterase
MLTTASIIASVLFAAAPNGFPVVSKSFSSLFEVDEYTCGAGVYQHQLFRYRLFVPRNQRPGKRYPLLVWLHGKGEDGSDNQLNLKWLELILDDPGQIEKYRFFILVVQCPREGPGWAASSRGESASSVGPKDMLGVTYEILQKTLQEQPVDEDRVYLSGVSAGGSACWEMALRYPEVFAAVAPLASGGGDTSRAATLVNVPVWAFHNSFDRGTPPDGVKRTVATIQGGGGNAHLTLFRSTSHECWQTAFRNYDLMGWMLDQHRGAWLCWTPPGSRPWRWWHVLGVPVAFLALLGAGWYSERRRRRQRRARTAATPELEPVHSDQR